ncbi:TPA: hypothetical protein ACUNF5_002724 [Burkholderia orbicola]|nr:hypothetical protein DF039_35725 [Burkholderia cenocepacia]
MMSYPQFTELAEWQISDYHALANPVWGSSALNPDVARAIARGAFNLWSAVVLQGFPVAERPTYTADAARLAALVDAPFPDQS